VRLGLAFNFATEVQEHALTSGYRVTMKTFSMGLAYSLILCAAPACAQPARSDHAAPVRQRAPASLTITIDTLVPALLASRNIPGASVAILRHDTVLHVNGYGMASLSTRQPVTPQTIFQIASLTKPITALAVMLLVEEGKLRLEDSASRIVPRLPGIYRALTIRQLLTHTSGISPDMRTANVDEMELEEFWRRLSQRPASFAPGNSIQYANAGYAILSFAVESVSGMSFGDFLQKRIFSPLGMASSAYRRPQSRDARHAVGYDLVDGRNVAAPHVFSGWGNSGIETTIEDLARFATAVQRGLLVNRSTWHAIFSPGRLANGEPNSFSFGSERATYGLGWFLTAYKGRVLHTHGGAIAGFSSILNRFPTDGYSVIVLSNGKQGADRLGQADAIARAVADIIF
jgi:CubicO group peptidase (beta-lactamase class C family)